MRILALDTSTDQFGVALIDDQRVLATYEILAERPHAVELPQAVTRVLQASRMTLEQVDAFAIDIGPGSFTGLRVGVAFLKALVFRLQKPVVSVISLDVLAANILYAPRVVCPVLDAKQKKVYTAWYRTDSGRVQRTGEPLLLPFDVFLKTLTEPVILMGDGAGVYRQRLQEQLGDRAFFAPAELGFPRAATVGRLAFERLASGEQDDPKTLVPLYLYPRDSSVRKPNATTVSA